MDCVDETVDFELADRDVDRDAVTERVEVAVHDPVALEVPVLERLWDSVTVSDIEWLSVDVLVIDRPKVVVQEVDRVGVNDADRK